MYYVGTIHVELASREVNTETNNYIDDVIIEEMGKLRDEVDKRLTEKGIDCTVTEVY